MPWNAVAEATAGWICYLSVTNVQLAPQLSFQKEATERLWPSLGSRNGDLGAFIQPTDSFLKFRWNLRRRLMLNVEMNHK